MSMFDEARSVATMMKMRNLSQKEVAKMLGVSQSYVANKLRLLKLGVKVRKGIVENGLSERHARALLRLGDEDTQVDAIEKIRLMHLTVAETEAMVDTLVMKESPLTISRSKMLGVIDSFIDSTKQSLEVVRASGAGAKSKIYYENSKLYISICIDENGCF